MQEPKINRVYRHFKGDYYLLVDVATHSETGEPYAVYRKLYGDGSLFVRPLSLFLGELDRSRYPEAGQAFRFQLMDICSVARKEPARKEHCVCLINDSFPPEIDGVANAVINYASLINGGLGRAVVVTPDHPEADDRAFSFPVLRYPSLDMTKQLGYRAGLPFSPELQQKLTGANFDIIHSHCPISSTVLARMLRSSIDVPIVFTYHTKFDIEIAGAIRSRLLQEEAKRLLVQNISACNEVWTVSRGAGENLRALGYDGRYVVMPNGVDFPQGRVDDALVRRVTSACDLPAGLPVFLFVGRMMWYKGIRILLEGLKLLSAGGQDFRMVFIGDGGDKEEIVSFSSSLGLDGKVFFHPPIHDREQIRAWYCRADLFLFPSTFDTNGLVVREAAACALASVLVAGSCAAEGVADGVSGFLIEESAGAMAEKLRVLCANPSLMASAGAGAQRELYISWESSVKSAYERYGAVIDNYRRGLCPAKAEFSDDFFHAAAQAMDALSRARSRGLAFRADVTDACEKTEERMKDRLSSVSQYFDRFL